MTQVRKRKSRRAGSAVEIEVTLPTLFTSCRSTIRAAGRHLTPALPRKPEGQTEDRWRKPVANDPVAPAWGRPSTTHSGVRSIGTLAASVQVWLRRAPSTVNRRPHMRIALYQPDIPQNTGTILRLCACLGIEAHIIAPAGFPTSDRAFRRAGMDYLDTVALVRHTSWHTFEAWRRPGKSPAVAVYNRRVCQPTSITLPAGRRAAVRPRIGRRAPRGPRLRRRPPRHPDAAGPALAQCGGGGRHGDRRGAATDGRDAKKIGAPRARETPRLTRTGAFLRIPYITLIYTHARPQPNYWLRLGRRQPLQERAQTFGHSERGRADVCRCPIIGRGGCKT